MNLPRMSLACLALAVGLCAAPALAHHAFISDYDCKKPIALKGHVLQVEWVNPHIFVHVRPDEAGKPDWIFEGAPPGAVARMGIDHDNLKEGDAITISGHQEKDHLCPVNAATHTATCTAIGGAIVLANGTVSNLAEDVRVLNSSVFNRYSVTPEQLLAQLGDFCAPLSKR